MAERVYYKDLEQKYINELIERLETCGYVTETDMFLVYSIQDEKRLNDILNYRTVSKYLSITPEEFEQKTLNRERRRNLALYEGVVTDWLKRHPDMSAA